MDEALFPLGLLIPFLTELGWVVETLGALIILHAAFPLRFCGLPLYPDCTALAPCRAERLTPDLPAM